MTQHARATFTAGRIALAAAALAAAFAIGFAVSKSRQASEAEIAGPAVQISALSLTGLEKAARENPGDASAWQALGIAYFSDGRFADAAGAYEKAVAIDPDEPALWSALGEARIRKSERDPMPHAAAAAFERAIALDPKDPRARYFLAVRKDLGGDHKGALDDWLALLEETPADAPWRTDLMRTIEQVGKINAIDVSVRLAEAGAKSPVPAAPAAARAIPGPSAQDLAAASRMRPSEQREMAEGMVARLENRLKGDPGNVEGWVMLMRSRMTLGQPERASKALANAIAANPAKAGFLKEQAGLLGVK